MEMMAISVFSSYRRRVLVGAFPSRIRMRGSIREAGASLVLEYRESWRDPATLHAKEGPLRRAEVDRSRLATIEVRRGWFGRATLVLRAGEFEALRGWPGVRGDVCTLGIDRSAGSLHLEAASELALRIADEQLRAIESPRDS
jgi:hypothetical protein